MKAFNDLYRGPNMNPEYLRRGSLRLAITAVITIQGGCASKSQTGADLVLVNGTVITVDSADGIAEAVAVRGNRIVAVGTTRAIESLVGPATRRIDLAGRP